jgi:peptidyl-prolyl cis-trans isomerase SurA
MDKIAGVLVGVKKNPDFTTLARKYSDDPNARDDGGDLGVFKKGEMLPEIEEKVIAMKPGEVSDIISTPTGFHIIKLEEKNADRAKPYDLVKQQIEETLYRKKSEERFTKWVEELRKGASVQISP